MSGDVSVDPGPLGSFFNPFKRDPSKLGPFQHDPIKLGSGKAS